MSTADQSDFKHGIRGFAQGCHCDICLEAKNAASERAVLRQSDKVIGHRTSNITEIAKRGRHSDDVNVQAQANKYLREIKRDYDDRVAALESLYTNEIGEVEQSVIDECAGLSIATDRPAMVATAQRLARILDNPKQVALHPTTSRQLTSILNDLRGNSKKRTRSRLAAVQRMVSPSSEKPTGTT